MASRAHRWLIVASVCAAPSWSAAQDSGAEKPQEAPPPASESPTGPDAVDWQQMSGPTEHHKRLDVLVGAWDQVFKSRTSPDGEWSESKGATRFRWILGGRYLVEEAKCDFQGMPFEWMSIYGYDAERKKYTAYWVDNLSTSSESAECEPSTDGKTFAFRGEQHDPRTGAAAPFEWLITIESPQKVRVEMFEVAADGTRTKSIEIEHTKAAEAQPKSATGE